MKKLLLILLLFTTFISAQSLKSVYFLSEGGFSPETSQLSKLDAESGDISNSIVSLGLYPDGLLVDSSNIYVCEQGSWGSAGKVYVLDFDGSIIDTTDVGINPFSLTKANNKLYFTNGSSRLVSVLDAKTLDAKTEINVGVFPQEILAIGNFVFVANTAEWGGDVDSTVSVIDATADTIVTAILVKPSPSSLAIASDGNLLIGCGGDENSGIIYKVNSTSLAKIDSFTVAGEGFGGSISVDKNSDNIYFLSNNNNLVEFNLASKNVRVVASPTVGTEYFYGYNFDYINKQHYIANAKDFSANGEVILVDNEGNRIKSYETGIAPRRIAFRYSDKSTDIAIENSDIANEFSLSQNYPNPFNPTTKISFTIDQKSNVKLNVYNVVGKLVKTLVNEELTNGIYVVNFNAENLSSGIYFYSLQTTSGIITKKMTLIK